MAGKGDMGGDPQTKDSRTLNDMEMTSVRALVSYVAHNQKTSEALVEQVVTSEFGVADIADLKRKSYDNVVRFLVDLQVDILLN